MKMIIFLFLLPFALYPIQNELKTSQLLSSGTKKLPKKSARQPHPEPNQVEVEFQLAKKMFDPWYTGPLITPSSEMMPPKVINYQPYIFVQTNYEYYDRERSAQPINNQIQLINWQIFQTGITNWMDAMIIVQGTENWQSRKNGGSFGDISLILGWPLALQTIWTPQIKLAVKETFPSGSFNHLSKNGLALDGVGMGSYQTTISLTFSKVLFWDYVRPMNTRLYLGYTIPTTAHVGGFNTYGGGYGTRGKVRPGNNFSADLGIEWCVSQPWVLALDLVYIYNARDAFTGYSGVFSSGAPAKVGRGSNDNLSLAPALEYNWNQNLSVISGAWFSVYGRNSNCFATGLFSLTWTFQPR